MRINHQPATPSHQEVLNLFTAQPAQNEMGKEALKVALDVRKFEIELYWKRATYFWVFIAAALTGFIAVRSSTHAQELWPVSLMISALGLVFSIGWYFVNRGSKYWQENWEWHVAIQEERLIGPLFKTFLEPNDSRIWPPTGNYPFSVSKINHLLNLAVIAMWLVIFYSQLGWSCNLLAHWKLNLAVLGVHLFIVLLFLAGRNSNHSLIHHNEDRDGSEVRFRTGKIS